MPHGWIRKNGPMAQDQSIPWDEMPNGWIGKKKRQIGGRTGFVPTHPRGGRRAVIAARELIDL